MLNSNLVEAALASLESLQPTAAGAPLPPDVMHRAQRCIEVLEAVPNQRATLGRALVLLATACVEAGRVTEALEHLRRAALHLRTPEDGEAPLPAQPEPDTLEAVAGSVAYEFNNLLTVILCNAVLVGEAPLDVRQRGALEALQAAGADGARLAGGLLAMGNGGSAEADRSPRSSTNSRAIVDELLPLLRSVLGVDVTLEVRDIEPGAQVRGDVERLQRLLVDLVVRARAAMPEGGALAIHCGVVRGAAAAALGLPDTPDEVWSLRVSDTGVRGGDLPGATDLLARARALVAEFGGKLEHSTGLRWATTWELLLPLADAPSEGPGPPAAAAAPGDLGGKRILLAEDDDRIRRLLVRVLEAAGAQVFEARDGREALTIWTVTASGVAYDAVVSDLHMPHMGGFELVAALRSMGATGARVPVMYISANGLDRELEPGAAFLRKPFLPAEFCERLAGLCCAV